MRRPRRLGPLLALLTGCASPEPDPLVVVTINTGTGPEGPHDETDDGYGSAEAALSDEWYGNGLAWNDVIDDASAWFATTAPDLVVFQEIFHPDACPEIPEDAREGFVCATWQPGDPTVAQALLGDDFQVACHLGKPDKCAAVRRDVGTFRGCDADLCLDGLDGAELDGCGSGSRVGRGTIELADGELVLVNVHGSSGFADEDMACRERQFAQIFDDLDGEPAANGERNLVMGDLNTDPGRSASFDPSAAAFADGVDRRGMHFVSEVGPDAPPSYATVYNIDHVVSDALSGDCWTAGLTEGHPPVTDVMFFDHLPVVCTLAPGDADAR